MRNAVAVLWGNRLFLAQGDRGLAYPPRAGRGAKRRPVHTLAADTATSLGGLTQGFCSSKLSAVIVEKLSQDNLRDHSPLPVSKAACYRGWRRGRGSLSRLHAPIGIDFPATITYLED